jgi:hypothetical protein
MNRPKWFWILAGILFAVASVAINYEVKIGMHQRAGSVQKLSTLKQMLVERIVKE